MARKSRKAAAVVTAPEIDVTCRAAVYVRLSVESKYSHSESINTQQMIIAQYLEKNPEISVYDTYIDNGATGTNFHRPAFQQMLSDIEAGCVNCVIVKDLSRLGRNSIDTGYYIEHYFRSRNIRFIAINEQYDTADPDDAHSGIMIPLRNMINEAYALDIGRKIKAQQRQAMKDGKFVGGRAPYGYLKAPDDCHQLIIDPVAAPVVRQIFQWASEGEGLNTIVLRLNKAGYLAPSYYKKSQGTISNEKLLGNGNWQTWTVKKILRSEVYTGDLVQGQTKIIDHRQVKAARDEWTVVRGTHEAIISRELFDAVQKNLDHAAAKREQTEVRSYTPNILRGKVFCAHCGGNLHRMRCPRKKGADRYAFHCISNSRVGKKNCPGVFIYEESLLTSLADMIQEELNTALGQYSLSLAQTAHLASERAKLKEKIASRRRDTHRLRESIRGLYEHLVEGILSKDEYFSLKGSYETKIEQLAAEIGQLESGVAAIDRQIEEYRTLEKDAEDIRRNRELTAELIDRLIDRIEVSKDKKLTVRFKFRSEFESCEEVLEQCRNMK